MKGLVPVTMLLIGRRRPRKHPPTSRGSPMGDDVISGQKFPLGRILRNFRLRMRIPLPHYGWRFTTSLPVKRPHSSTPFGVTALSVMTSLPVTRLPVTSLPIAPPPQMWLELYPYTTGVHFSLLSSSSLSLLISPSSRPSSPFSHPASPFSHPASHFPGSFLPVSLYPYHSLNETPLNRHRNVYVKLTPQSGQPLKTIRIFWSHRWTVFNLYIIYWRCAYCLELVFGRIFKIPSCWT